MARGRPLCLEEREEISRGIAAGDSGRQIAGRLGRHYSVVNREIMRNGGRSADRASDAHQNAKASAQRPKERKLEHNPLLLAEINKGLHQKWLLGVITQQCRSASAGSDHPKPPGVEGGGVPRIRGVDPQPPRSAHDDLHCRLGLDYAVGGRPWTRPEQLLKSASDG